MNRHINKQIDKPDKKPSPHCSGIWWNRLKDTDGVVGQVISKDGQTDILYNTGTQIDKQTHTKT